MLDGYNDTVNQLYSRYTALLDKIDREHNARAQQIESTRKDSLNTASAVNTISLNNTKAELLEKGLSRSGESVQSNIEHNIAKNNAFSDIEKNASRERAENEASRANAKTDAALSLFSDIASADETYSKMYLDQLNADREYEADRDDEKFDRYTENREYEADRDDEQFDRYTENREYEADRDDEAYERSADARDYELKKQESESKAEESKKSEDKDESTAEAQSVLTDADARELVSAIILKVNNKYAPGSEIAKSTIKQELRKLIVDGNLSFEYRQKIKACAKELGYY